MRLLLNEHGRLVDRTREAGLADRLGWWNSIAAGDIDNDGDIDYVVGNLGMNTRYKATPERPALAFLGEFDHSGRTQIVEAVFAGDALLPLRSLNALTEAMPSLSERFASVESFASSSLAELVTTSRLQAARRGVVNTLESGVWLNDGHARLRFQPLPRLAQASPVFGLALTDVDADGRLDLFLVGNFFSPQPETGRMDGGVSLLLRGNGDGTFAPIGPHESGLIIPGDAKSLAVTDLNQDCWPDFVVGVNHGALRTFENATPRRNRMLSVVLDGRAGNPAGIGARVKVTLADGPARVAELHAGGGYLSQSTRILSFGLGSTESPRHVEVRWANGQTSRMVPLVEQRVVRIQQ